MDRTELRAKAEDAAARLRQLPTGGAGESQLAAVYGKHDWNTLQELELRDRWLLADAWMVDNWPPGYDPCADRDKLKKFKDYVHARLDAAGVPADPESPHRAEGCRIGGRLDIVLADRHRLADVYLRWSASTHEPSGDPLLDRLRGIYTVPVNDGAGLLDGKDTFTRRFPTLPLNLEAAAEIELLRSLLATLPAEQPREAKDGE